MNRALPLVYGYLTSEEGTFGIATVTVLVLACVVMLRCVISYPAIGQAFAFSG
jgi:hypothetical protein